jgi:hemolysin activation/secretion protein
MIGRMLLSLCGATSMYLKELSSFVFYINKRVIPCITLPWLLAAAMGSYAAEMPSTKPATFDIFEYRVEGNSLLKDAAIELAVMPFMGEGKTLAAVEAARTTLERQYHDAGYLTVYVSIPEQSTEGGVIALKVVESPISKLRVVGSQFHAPSNIKSGMTEVAEGRVPNFLAVQEQLAQVNRSADLRVAPILKPGKAPGTVEVQLDVDDQLPLHGSVELSNRQSPNTTATRLGASVRYDNLWQRHHSIGLTLQTSPENTSESRLMVLNYMMPASPKGDAISMYTVSSRSKFATIFNAPGLGVLGNTDIVGLRYSFPLASSNAYTQSFTVGLDYKNILQSVVLDGLAAPDPAVRYSPMSLAYSGSWLNQAGMPTTTLDVSTMVGMRGWLGNKDEVFERKRPGASAGFFALRTGLKAQQSWGQWQLSGKMDVQLASGPLLPSEQFVAGGADSVRGYLEGERAADQAVRLSFELNTPTLKLGQRWLGDWRTTGVMFADMARLQVSKPDASQASRHDMAGLGFGLRVGGPRGMNLQLDAAKALVEGDVLGGGTPQGEWRIHARWWMEF